MPAPAHANEPFIPGMLLGAPPTRLQAGDRVGPWIIERPLQRGGGAVVFEATHEHSGRAAALKVARADVTAPQRVHEALRAEADLLRRVVHPNVVELLETGPDDDGSPYLALVLSRGEDLAERLAREPLLPIELVIEIGKQLLAAIGAIAAAGVVHRDIKPENVMLEVEHGATRVRLIDLGIAAMTRDAWSGCASATGFSGTPEYVSPEQAQGLPVDVRSDLYSLGALLYELVTGRVPTAGSTQYETLVHVMTMEPVPPRVLRPECPTSLERVILRALAKERSGRFQSPDAMARALAACSSERGERTTRTLARAVTLSEQRGEPTLPIACEAAKPARREISGTRLAARPGRDLRRDSAEGDELERWLLPLGLVLVLVSLLGAVLGSPEAMAWFR